MEREELGKTMLFRGMAEDEIADALVALHAEERAYQKGAFLLRAGSSTERMGLVFDGGVTVESNDLWGNRTILSHVGEGQCFAETYALLESEVMPVDVVTNEACRVLFLRVSELYRFSPAQPVWAAKLISNLLAISAHKNLTLSARSFHTAPKSARGRIMAYLNTVSLQKRSREFDIPFDRQQMADYLNLDRSAMSKELGKMRRDGIIVCRKNHFIIQ